MKTRTRYMLMVMAVMMATVGCTRELTIDEPTERELVLNAEPQAGKVAFVNFAHTRFFLSGDNDQPVSNAELTLTVNGTRYSMTDSVVKCNYFFPYTLQGGDSLSVDVRVGEKEVHAETYVPLEPELKDFKTMYLEMETFNYIAATMKMDDHEDVDEIYSIAVEVRDSGARWNDWTGTMDTVDTISNTYFCLPYNPEVTSNEVCPYVPMVAEPIMLYGSRVMFLDRKIAGRKDYQLTLMIPQLVDTNEVEPFKHEYIITIKSVTPARYRYIISSTRQSGAMSFFAEQGEPFGNVKGALGIFAGSAKKEFKFDRDTVPGLSIKK